MAPIIQNLVMLLLPISSIWFMPTAAFPLLDRSEMATNVSTTNMTIESYKEHIKNEPALLPSKFTGNDSMTCEPTPSDCAQNDGEECMKDWYWDVHKIRVLISAKAFCEEVATTLDGLQAPVGKHYNIVDGGAIVDSYKSAYGVFGIGVEDTKECDTNEGFRYPSHPVSGYDCVSLVYGAWHQCDNKGQGGSVVARCLKYSIRPAKPSDHDMKWWPKTQGEGI